MQHRNLFVFDIETIPDTDAVPNLTGFTDPDVHARREELERYHLEITDGRNSFPRQPFHKVVAISFLEAEIETSGHQEHYFLKELRSGGEAGFDEAQLLQGFFQYFERLKPRLVSFNGRGFDLPVLKYRAMVHGIQSPWLHQAGDKWNSYSSRYSMDWHCDLMEQLSDYGASARVKLAEVCAAWPRGCPPTECRWPPSTRRRALSSASGPAAGCALAAWPSCSCSRRCSCNTRTRARR